MDTAQAAHTTIAFLLACLGMMANDPKVGRRTLLLIPVIAHVCAVVRLTSCSG